MPELPEVQTVVNTLRPIVVGRRISRVHLHRTDIVTPAGCDLGALMTGRQVIDLHRRGKRIVFSFDDGNAMYVHLGMTGRLVAVDKTADRAKHTHMILEFEGTTSASQVRFVDPRRFGGVFWLGKESADGDMGPEPLTMRASQLVERLEVTSRPIKNVLLDQTVLAGVGNIYADESLFAAKIHPLMPADRLSGDDVKRLMNAIKLTLRKAIRHRGSTLRDFVDADGIIGAYQKKHRVYDRKGEPCRVCRTAIERIVLGARSTHYCPTCQPRRGKPLR